MQAVLPLWPCEPVAGESGYARCWSFTVDPRHGGRNVRIVTRLCARGCACPVCLEGDAMVRAYNAKHEGMAA